MQIYIFTYTDKKVKLRQRYVLSHNCYKMYFIFRVLYIFFTKCHTVYHTLSTIYIFLRVI